MAREDVNQGTQDVASASSRPSWQLMLDELEATAWAKRFKDDSPVSYPQALRYARQENFRVHVHLHRTYETGETKWVISALDEDSSEDFWMDVTPTKKEALELCRLMGWKVAR